MHQPFRRLFPWIVLIMLFTGCTVEKRLYTKGWSVERHHRWKEQKGSGAQQQEDSEEIAAPEVMSFPEEPVAVSEGENVDFSGVVIDSSINEPALSVRSSVVENEELTDTIFVDEKDLKKPKKEWTKQRKRHSVATVSTLLLLVALSIVAFFLVLYAPGTTLIQTGFLILLTGVFGILFFILLVILLAFVFRKPVDKLPKPEEEMTPKQQRNEDIKNWILVSLVIAAGIFVLYKLFEQ